MDNLTDRYPSRLDRRIDAFKRLDPVTYRQIDADGPLSADEMAAYRNNGYLFFEHFLPEADVEQLLSELRSLSANSSLRQADEAILEPQSGELRSLFAMHRRSELFDRLTRDPRILGMVHQILDSDVYIHQSRINYKPGFKGNGFNWHSDFETWHTEDGMPRMRCLSCSIALTENNEFNGPLMLIPGSHRYFVPCTEATPEENYKTSLQSQQFGVPEEEDLRWLVAQGGIVAPKGPPGSMLLFECNTLHASNANISPFPRSNAFFVYNSVENALQAPYAAAKPRPEFLGSRRIEMLKPGGRGG